MKKNTRSSLWETSEFFTMDFPFVRKITLLIPLFLLFSIAGFAQFTATTSIGASQENWNSAGAWSFPAGFTPFEGFPNRDFDEDASTAAFNGDYGKFIIIDTNDNIKIPNNTTIDLRNSGITQITIRSGAELHFGSNAQLLLPASAVIVVESGAKIFSDSNSVGIFLEIGGNGVWGRGCQAIGCNNDDLTGPGTITKDSTPGSPLPVTLLYFSASVEKDFVKLNWATASELDFDRFVIEKTRDGKNFVEIGSVQGAGVSTSRIDYSFKDEKIFLGRSYYRLKAIDFSGYTEYFGVVTALVEGAERINVVPNPASATNVKIHVNFSTEDPLFYKVIDASGMEVYSSMILSEGFENEFAMNKTLTPGLYFLVVRQGQEKKIVRFAAY